MTVESKLILIKGYNLWSHLTEEEYEELDLIHNFITAKKGEYIYFHSSLHNKIFFAKEGYIKIGCVDDDGNEVIKEIIHKGELFGQITLEKNNIDGEFARAYKSDVSLCAFTIEDFLKLLQRKPQLAIPFSQQVGSKLRKVESRLVNLLNKDVKTRLINMLLQLVESDGRYTADNSAVIDRFLTHSDLAGLIASSRQTVTTMINELETQSLLVISKKEISIPNVKKLRNILYVV